MDLSFYSRNKTQCTEGSAEASTKLGWQSEPSQANETMSSHYGPLQPRSPARRPRRSAFALSPVATGFGQPSVRSSIAVSPQRSANPSLTSALGAPTAALCIPERGNVVVQDDMMLDSRSDVEIMRDKAMALRAASARLKTKALCPIFKPNSEVPPRSVTFSATLPSCEATSLSSSRLDPASLPFVPSSATTLAGVASAGTAPAPPESSSLPAPGIEERASKSAVKAPSSLAAPQVANIPDQAAADRVKVREVAERIMSRRAAERDVLDVYVDVPAATGSEVQSTSQMATMSDMPEMAAAHACKIVTAQASVSPVLAGATPSFAAQMQVRIRQLFADHIDSDPNVDLVAELRDLADKISQDAETLEKRL